MDPLTQGVLGGTIAAAGFRHRLGPKAVLFGAVAAMSPDVDVVVGLFGDEWTTLVAHRGSSHSLVVLPIAAPLVGWLGWRFFGGRRPPAGREAASAGRDGESTPGVSPWIHLAFWALITHPLLDACTTYGTQLLAPFSRARFSLDAISIIDPLYTLPLLIAVVASYLGRVPSARRRAVAWGALVLTTAYLGWGLRVTAKAEALAGEQLRSEGFPTAELRATPTFFYPPVRRLVARDGGHRFLSGAVSVWAPRPIHFTELESSADPRVDEALATRGGQVFQWFADGWVRAEVVHTGPGSGEGPSAGGSGADGPATVRLFDERYGLLTAPEFTPFVAEGRADPSGRIREVRQAGRARVDLDPRAELAAGWRLLRGLEP